MNIKLAPLFALASLGLAASLAQAESLVDGSVDDGKAKALTCTACHGGNSETVTYRTPTYRPDCAACHANDYDQGEHEGRSVSQNRDCAGSCHQSSPEHSVRDSRW